MTDIQNMRICTQRILNKDKAELDNIKSKKLEDYHEQRLKAAFFTKKIWPKGSKIRIAFLDKGDKIQRKPSISSSENDPLQQEVKDMSVQEAIKKIVNERFVPIVNLDIKFVDTPEKANVRISFDPDGGAWSLVGTDHTHQKTGATMNLGWFDVATVMHEFGHMLGMIHEHQNPRGENIKWDDKKLFQWAKNTQGWSEKVTEKNIINKYDISSINGSDFDPMSIMLYFFPGYLTTNNKGTEQNLRLSGLDLEWIAKTYPKEDGVSMSDFFKNIYNENINNSIEKSKKESETFTDSPSFNLKSLGLYILVGITILSIFYVISLTLKSNRKHKRYGK